MKQVAKQARHNAEELLTAAEGGCPRAQYTLGQSLYCEWVRTGLEVTAQQAVSWLKKAAAQGNLSSVDFLDAVGVTDPSFAENFINSAGPLGRAGAHGLVMSSVEDMDVIIRALEERTLDAATAVARLSSLLTPQLDRALYEPGEAGGEVWTGT